MTFSGFRVREQFGFDGPRDWPTDGNNIRGGHIIPLHTVRLLHGRKTAAIDIRISVAGRPIFCRGAHLGALCRFSDTIFPSVTWMKRKPGVVGKPLAKSNFVSPRVALDIENHSILANSNLSPWRMAIEKVYFNSLRGWSSSNVLISITLTPELHLRSQRVSNRTANSGTPESS